jgi:hypothetical protein
MFSAPSSWSAGTNMSSKCSSTVSDERRPILFSRLPTLKPGVFVSTMNELIPRVPFDLSVFAVKTTTCATEPFVM